MEEETKPPFETKPAHRESRVFGMSLRGIIVLIVVITVCVMSFTDKTVEEPLYTLVGMVMGYYFGQNQRPQQPQPPKT